MNSWKQKSVRWALYAIFVLVVTLVPVSYATAGGFESQVDGAFNGWDGETVVRLTNGTIWLQREYYYEYHYAYRPRVIVYTASGGWKMQVEGVSRAVAVERLR